MRTEKAARPSRLLRVREFTEKVTKRPAKAAAETGRSRFVGPYYFAAEYQAAIKDCLVQAGIGDADGRTLFITAVEYEIAGYRVSVADTPAAKPAPKPRPSSKAQTELAHLGSLVQDLVQTLDQLQPAARKLLDQRLTESDRFGRRHDERYLAALGLEFERIADACAGVSAAEQEVEPPRISQAVGALVGQLARIYRECLEVRLPPGGLENFGQVLHLIGEASQIDLPREPEILAGLLDRT